MSAHPDPRELHAFAGRRLPPAAALRIDAHLSACTECRALLAAASSPGRDLAAVAGVVRAGAHLGFEQMQSYVDERLSPAQRTTVEAHTALCTMCRRELADLALHAPALRRPLPTGAATAATPRWRNWFAVVPTLAVAAFIGTVVITVVMHDRGAQAPHESMRSTPGAASLSEGLNHQALDELASISMPAAEAWRARDFTRLVSLLQPLAERGQPLALSALASLHAQGLGVAKDPRMAEQYWQRAADLGQPHAGSNIEVLRRSAASR